MVADGHLEQVVLVAEEVPQVVTPMHVGFQAMQELPTQVEVVAAEKMGAQELL